MSVLRYPRLEIVLFVLLAVFLLAGAASVPFHPDETSWLYQSRDLEALFRAPASLPWRTETPPSQDLTYRLLNAPLAKYVLGAARLAAGYPAETVSTDWDWTQSWDENTRASALPSPGLLAAGRVASTLLLVSSLVPIYFAGRALGGRASGLGAALLLATNALALLHGRRSMAEGALILGVSLALLGLFYADRHPWLAGIASGLAFAAKTSAGVWIPLGWFGAAWTTETSRTGAPQTLRRIAAYSASAFVTIVLLFPVLWAEPLGATRAMLDARQDLVDSQIAEFGEAMPETVLATPAERMVSMLAQLFIAPPQFAEAANYTTQTADAEASYLRTIGHDVLRGFVGGAAILIAAILGLVLGIRVEARAGPAVRRIVLLAFLATLVQAIALIVFVPLSFQRYVVPLVPLVCLWAGHGIAGSITAVNRNRRARGPAAAT